MSHVLSKGFASLCLASGALFFGLHAGSANAVLLCTFGIFSGCNNSIGNATFSGFTIGNNGGTGGLDNADTITISILGNGKYQVSSNYNNFGAPLGSTGNYSFNIATATGFRLKTVSGDSNRTGGNFVFTDTLTNLPASPFNGSSLTPSYSFNPNTSSSLVTVSWTTSGGAQANSSSLLFELEAQPVPGPLPLAGAATAFSLSRQMRRRIKPLA
jgi:hypothetical protein